MQLQQMMLPFALGSSCFYQASTGSTQQTPPYTFKQHLFVPLDQTIEPRELCIRRCINSLEMISLNPREDVSAIGDQSIFDSRTPN